MLLKLHKIELANIRSHESSVFKPESEGITALKGPTGSGKSTFVDAIAWALYGTKPSGVSKASEIMRSKVKFAPDTFFVEVVFTIDDRRFTVKRKFVSKGGAVECNVYQHETDDSIKHMAGPAVSHAQKEIRNILHMDEKGFLTAVLVQQKEIDKIINEGPGERAEVIEKLTGISSITKALENSKNEVKSIKQAIDHSTVSDGTLEQLKKEKIELDSKKSKCENNYNTLKDRISTAQEKLHTLMQNLTHLEKEFSTREQLEYKISLLEPSISEKKLELDSLQTEHTQFKNELAEIESVGSYSDIKEKLSDAKQELEKLSNVKYTVEEMIASYQKDITKLNDEIIDMGEIKKTDLEKTLSEHKETHENCRVIVETQKALIRSRLQAKKAIDEGDGECPTCLQTVENPVETLRTYTREVSEAKGEITAKQREISEIESNISKVEDQIRTLTNNIHAEATLKDLHHEVEIKTKEKSKARREYSMQKKKVDALQIVFDQAQKGEELLNRKNQVSEKISRMIETHASDEKTLEGYRQELKKIRSSSSEQIEKKRATVNNLEQKISSSTEKINNLHVQLSVLNEREKTLVKNLVTEENNVENYQKLLETLETETATFEVISEFRENRIASAVPTIEASASRFLSKFTEGRFVRVKLDAKFRVKVTNSLGEEFSAGVLSGGELSSVALSIRLAISILLSGGDASGLIILDEVLVSQDPTRAELILNTIKEIFHGQVVIIAHNESVDAVVDKTILLGQDS